MKEKIKVKIGMVDLGNKSVGSSVTRKVLILEEYDTQYLVLWGKKVNSNGYFDVNPNGIIINKERLYNIKEREISKFKLWCYKYWNNNF